MWSIGKFPYRPDDDESEKASNSYLMSVVAVMVGLPLPVINMVATLFFYIANRRGKRFVRWHCTQALLSQAAMLAMNAPAFYWTLSILFGDRTVTNPYLSYMLTVVLFNILEFIATVFSAVQTRRGRHVVWWVFGPVTNLLAGGAAGTSDGE